MMDLADLLGNLEQPPPERPVDLSGLPCPTRAFVTLSSGVVVNAAVIFRGIYAGERLYRVVAELDWSTANIKMVEVDRWPPDVRLTLRVPDEWDDMRCKKFGHDIEWKVAGEHYQPRRIERTPE